MSPGSRSLHAIDVSLSIVSTFFRGFSNVFVSLLPLLLSYQSHTIRQFTFYFFVGRERSETTAGNVFIIIMSKLHSGTVVLFWHLKKEEVTASLALRFRIWRHEIISMFLQKIMYHLPEDERLYMLTTSKHRFYLFFFIIYFVWKYLFLGGGLCG